MTIWYVETWMMCFLGPDGFPAPMTAAPEGDAPALVVGAGVGTGGAAGKLGEGMRPLLLVGGATATVEADDDDEMPATLLTPSPDPTTSPGDAHPLSSFLDPWNTALRSADLEIQDMGT